MTKELKHENAAYKKSLPTVKEVGEYKVRKLKLTEYALVIEELKSLPYIVSQFEKLDEKNNEAIFAVLPEIILKAMPEVIAVLAIVTNEDKKKLEDELDLLTAVELVKASIEVNGFLEVSSSLKSLMKLRQ